MNDKIKRPTSKVFVVSDDTHKKLKDYANKMGYKLQYVADEAVVEYLKRKEIKQWAQTTKPMQLGMIMFTIIKRQRLENYEKESTD